MGVFNVRVPPSTRDAESFFILHLNYIYVKIFQIRKESISVMGFAFHLKMRLREFLSVVLR